MTEKEKNKPIYVTQPALPPLEEFTEYLKIIWENKRITNSGPFHKEFEEKLAEYLGVKYISLFANGTLALLTALQTLSIKGEVITTPFSFVATTHALWWNNIKPVFADIDKDDFSLSPEAIESVITSETTAILPVHVYGNPCKVGAIQKVAKKHDLKLIYDSAHAFGVNLKEDSILNFGDLSILSFHATKVFNSIEGGAIVCHDAKTKERIDHLKNFGFVDETTIIEPGINAKMNEVQAAYGLLQLKYVDQYISKRKEIAEIYRSQLAEISGIKIFDDINNVKHNYSYFPILVNRNVYGRKRDELYDYLKENNIHTRRYFYPLISSLTMYKDLPSSRSNNLPNAENAAKDIICLPIYPDLSHKDVNMICRIINEYRII